MTAAGRRASFKAVLAFAVLAFLAAGAWVLKPILFRPTACLLAVLPAGPERVEVLDGALLALEEAAHRGGRLRLVLHDLVPAMADGMWERLHYAHVTRSEDRITGNSNSTFVMLLGTPEVEQGLQEAGVIVLPGLKIDKFPPMDPGTGRCLGSKLKLRMLAVSTADSESTPVVLSVDDSPGRTGRVSSGGELQKFIAVLRTLNRENFNLPRLIHPDALLQGEAAFPAEARIFLDAPGRGRQIVRTLRSSGVRNETTVSGASLGIAQEDLDGLDGLRADYGRLDLPPEDFVRRFRDRFGRPAGPLSWIGYRSCRSVVDGLDRADAADHWGLSTAMTYVTPPEPGLDLLHPMPILAEIRGGRFEFVRTLK